MRQPPIGWNRSPMPKRVEDHVDEFFVDLVLMGLARELRLVLLGLNAALPSRPRRRARGSKSCTSG